jgi:hypothetical protein
MIASPPITGARTLNKSNQHQSVYPLRTSTDAVGLVAVPCHLQTHPSKQQKVVKLGSRR